MERKEKLAMLQKLSEEELTKQFLISLFQKMGFRNVKYDQGVLEYGQDIIYCEETRFHKLKYVWCITRFLYLGMPNSLHILEEQILKSPVIFSTSESEHLICLFDIPPRT